MKGVECTSNGKTCFAMQPIFVRRVPRLDRQTPRVRKASKTTRVSSEIGKPKESKFEVRDSGDLDGLGTAPR